MPAIMKISEVARELGVHPDTLKAWSLSADNSFPARIADCYQWMFVRTEIESWIAEHTRYVNSLKRDVLVTLHVISHDDSESDEGRKFAHDVLALLLAGSITVEQLAGVGVAP